MSIKLIQDPPYVINFNEFLPGKKEVENLPILEKIQSIALTTLEHFKCLCIALLKSSYTTLSYSGTSFKYIVLGYYGNLRDFSPPNDLYLAVFRVAIWILGLAWCTLASSVRLYLEMTTQKKQIDAFLSQFINQEIDASHIQSHEISLDASGVPIDVQVDQWSQIFDRINFTDPQSPGYMAPLSRREATTTYTVNS